MRGGRRVEFPRDSSQLAFIFEVDILLKVSEALLHFVVSSNETFSVVQKDHVRFSVSGYESA